jgi:hypothetical protein
MIVLEISGLGKRRAERGRAAGRKQPPMPVACLHCRAVAPENRLGLCGMCAARVGVWHTYRRRAHWTVALEMRLRALAEKAEQKRDLFGGENHEEYR